MGGVLINNYVLQQFLGICPFLGVSKKVNQAVGMGVAVTFVMLVATAATWPIYTYILFPKYTYLQTIVFILVIATLVQFVEIVLKRFIPSLFKALGVYLPLITTNCAVLGVALNNISDGFGFVESMVSSLGVGLGFLLAMVLFAGVRERLETASIPKHLKGDGFPVEFEIRGEIFMPYSAFDQLNSERAEIGEPLFANPRNAAAGSLKLLDSEEVRSRKLDAVFYHLLGENLPYTTHYEQLEAVKSWGLPVSEHSQICHSIDQVESYLVKWDSARKELPYATDGVVIKLNQIEPRESLGYTSKSPRWATAYKFKAERALTKILSVDYQIGRTGVITPVANLEPVLLSGTVVKRATLHNEDQMNILDIHEGDSVYIEKGGEIIPKIIEVELSQRVPNAQKVTFPTLCPDCETPLVKEEDDARYFCPNSDGCYSQIKERFVHFASRKAMNILAGDSTFEQLIKKLNVKELSDLYHLTKEQLLTLDSWKDRSAERFLKSIEESKDREFYRVLYSLGIRQIGESTAKLLTSHFKTIDAIAAASLEELVEIDEVGDIVAQSIIDYFSNDKNIKLITALKEIGLQFEEKNSTEKVLSEALLGKNIVISGNFSKPREEMKKLIVLHGGKSLSSISSKTDYLLSGTKSGPEKLKKAEQLGIEIITETQFFEMIK